MWLRQVKSRRSRLYSDAADDDDSVKQEPAEAGKSTSTSESFVTSMNIQPVGVVRSIYQLCTGTPRQGLLAPHARGRVELSELPIDIATDSVTGLEEFSHIWIVFLFHLNTNPSSGGGAGGANGDEHLRRRRAKIAPPALGGKKVGVFATRSPHRFNPIGMTLVKLDSIQIQTRHVQGQKPVKTVCLHVSGLDLVDGTPVIDIKPYVPDYDGAISMTDNDSTNTDTANSSYAYNLPTWVSEGLATKRDVCIDDTARQELRSILFDEKDTALEFYGRGAGESPVAGLEHVLKCIQEVLAMDVRSAWQTKKARQGKSQADRAARLQHVDVVSNNNDVFNEISNGVSASASVPSTGAECTQQIDNLLIHYTIEETTETSLKRPTSQGSGAEDKVIVTSIQLLMKHNNNNNRDSWPRNAIRLPILVET
jgi:tRNA-Thr(GGU) m(6)t(6)A37 methyltransferase TsaA